MGYGKENLMQEKCNSENLALPQNSIYVIIVIM